MLTNRPMGIHLNGGVSVYVYIIVEQGRARGDKWRQSTPYQVQAAVMWLDVLLVKLSLCYTEIK